jgi:hypothetical protein
MEEIDGHTLAVSVLVELALAGAGERRVEEMNDVFALDSLGEHGRPAEDAVPPPGRDDAALSSHCIGKFGSRNKVPRRQGGRFNVAGTQTAGGGST